MSKERKSNFRGKVHSNAKKQRSGGGGSYLNLPKGVTQLILEEDTKKVKFDFLPYEVTDAKHPDRDDKSGTATPGSLWYRRPFKVHKNVGAGNGTSCVCLASVGKKCPICEFQTELFKTDKAEAIKLYPKQRYLYIVIPLDLKKHDSVPFVWDVAESLFQDTLRDALDEDSDNEIFPDLEEGKTLELSFKWKSIGENSRAFPETRHITFEDRDAYDEEILEKVPNLDEALKILTYDELNAKFQELEDEEPADTVDDDEKKEEKQDREKKSLKKKEPEKEEKKEYDWNDLLEMSQTKLERLCKTEDLDVVPADFDDDVNSLRKAIAKELEIEYPQAKKKTMERSPKEEKTSEKKKVCPHGHKFGVDAEDFDECDDCKLWSDCIDAKEKK
jgi:hypothetical protein